MAPALADLVRSVRDRGLSYREMAARARRAGHSISHSHLAALASDNVAKTPSDDDIRAIAAALDMGYERVRSAVFDQFYGYVPRELGNRSGSRISAALPPDLSPEEEEQIARMVRAWIASSRGHDS